MDATYYTRNSKYDYVELQDCVTQYQKTGRDFYLEATLYKLKDTFRYFMYTKTNYPDKGEVQALLEDTVLACLESYNPNGQATFLTYFNAVMNNKLINFYSANKRKYEDLSTDVEYEGSDAESLLNAYIINDMSIVNTESQILLQSLKDKLDDSEYRVCEVLLNENHKLTKTEVSEQLGMTVSAISNIYKRLQKRFAQNKVFQVNY